MSNENLNSLLKEYSQKKISAELDAEKRKEGLYKQFPRLEEIDSEINKYAILTTKNILNKTANSSELANFKNKINDLSKEKFDILLKNNYSEDYLHPFYECSICNDTGYVVDDNYNTKMCSCLQQRLLDYSFKNSNLANVGTENFENFDETLFSDEVDLSKYGFNISPRKNILNIKNNSLEFITNFDSLDQKNLLFAGSTGLRKKFHDNLYSKRIIKKRKNCYLSNCSYFIRISY